GQPKLFAATAVRQRGAAFVDELLARRPPEVEVQHQARCRVGSQGGHERAVARGPHEAELGSEEALEPLQVLGAVLADDEERLHARAAGPAGATKQAAT